MSTVLWYLSPSGEFEEQEVTIDEIREAGFEGLSTYWAARAGETYPQETLQQFFSEILERTQGLKGAPATADTYLTVVRIAQGVTEGYFPRRGGTYQYSLVMESYGTRSVGKRDMIVVCRDFDTQSAEAE